MISSCVEIETSTNYPTDISDINTTQYHPSDSLALEALWSANPEYTLQWFHRSLDANGRCSTFSISERTAIKIIPSDFAFMSELCELDLEFCGVETLPSEIGSMEKLKQIYLPANNLTTLPEEITNLKPDRFVIERNSISRDSISDSVGQWLDMYSPGWDTLQWFGESIIFTH